MASGASFFSNFFISLYRFASKPLSTTYISSFCEWSKQEKEIAWIVSAHRTTELCKPNRNYWIEIKQMQTAWNRRPTPKWSENCLVFFLFLCAWIGVTHIVHVNRTERFLLVLFILFLSPIHLFSSLWHTNLSNYIKRAKLRELTVRKRLFFSNAILSSRIIEIELKW